MTLRWLYIVFLFLSLTSVAQIDTRFWFAPPDISNQHQSSDDYIELRMASLATVPVTVTISQPANPTSPINIAPITINPGQSYTVNFSNNAAFKTSLETVANGVQRTGLLVSSTGPITAYYEVGRASSIPNNATTDKNGEIFTLKGSNALGTRFFTPFQNRYANNTAFLQDANSSIDIVATENATQVTFRLTQPGVSGGTTYNANANHTITLQRGETFSIRAAGTGAAQHMSGSLITSNKPIAITQKDDTVQADWATGSDIIGDQLIPVNLVGTEYIVPRGYLGPNTVGRNEVFIVPVENATEIRVNGVIIANNAQAGTIVSHMLSSASPGTVLAEQIIASKPVYVYYVSGYGSEMGGPLLPPMKCTGSTKVSFIRSSADPFFITIIARQDAIGSFLVQGRNDIIRASDFTFNIGGWYVAQKRMDGLELPAGIPPDRGIVVENTRGYFHLGIINGTTFGGTSRFGYFSDFGRINSQLPTTVGVCPGLSVPLDPKVLNLDSAQTQWFLLPNTTTPVYVGSRYQTTQAGRYEVRMADTRGCLFTDTVALNFHTVAPFSLGKTSDTVCFNVAEPITVNGNWSRIQWTRRPTGVTIADGIRTYNPTVSGQYEVTVTDANACTKTAATNITYNNNLSSFDLGAPNSTVCFNRSTPIVVTGSYSNITWRAPVTIPNNTTSHNPTVSGKYVVTVFNTFRCSNKDSVNVTFDDRLRNFGLGDDNSTVCFNVSKPIEISGGPFAGATITWTTPNPVAVPQGTMRHDPKISGVYRVDIVQGSCSATDQVNVNYADGLKDFDLGPASSTVCFNANKPIVVNGNYGQINWTAPATVSIPAGTRTHNPAVAGRYTVTVIDAAAAACNASDFVDVTLDERMKPFNLGPDNSTVCFNKTNPIVVNVASGTQVVWAAPAAVTIPNNTLSHNPIVSGIYKVTATLGTCTAIDQVTVNYSDGLRTFALGPDNSTVCFNVPKPIVVNGTYGKITWTPPATVVIAEGTKSHNPTRSGKYVVTVQDINAPACTAKDSVLVTYADGLKDFQLGADNSLVCFNQPNPIVVNGTYNDVQWKTPPSVSVPDRTYSYNPKTGGKYVVTVFDTFGCNAKDSVNINYISSFNLDLGTKREVCIYQPFTIDVTKANIVKYEWSTNVASRRPGLPGNTISTYKPDTSGIYAVKLTDVNGCTDQDTLSFTLVQDLSLDLGTDRTACSYDNFVINATGNYKKYEWGNNAGVPNPSDTSFKFQPVVSGKYWLKVTDQSELCTDQDTITVRYVPDFSFYLGKSPDTVCFNNPRLIQASDVKFNNGFIWQWEAPAGEVVPAGAKSHFPKTSGFYEVTVTDPVTNCIDQDTVTITYSNLLAGFDLGAAQDTACFNVADTISAVSSKFNTGFMWSWKVPQGAVNPLDAVFALPTAGGKYIAIVKDIYNCMVSDTVDVAFSNDLFAFDLGDGQDTVCFNLPQSIKATNAKYNTGYSWTWTVPAGVANPGNVTSVLPKKGGLYKVVVQDRLLCEASDEVLIKYSNSLDGFDLGNNSLVSCKIGSDTLKAVDAKFNSAIFVWNWKVPVGALNPARATNTIPYVTGMYTVTIVDSLLCEASDAVNVTLPPVIDLGLNNNDTVACSYSNYVIRVPAGFANYRWVNNVASASSNIFKPTSSGTYWVEVTDRFGCKASDTVMVSYVPPISVSLGPDYRTICDSNPSDTLTPGSGYDTYLWPDGSRDSIYVPPFPGNIQTSRDDKVWVTVTRESCVASDTVIINFINFKDIVLGPDTSVCEGYTVTLDAGPGFFNYNWVSAEDPQKILHKGRVLTTNKPGLYTVFVTSACGPSDFSRQIMHWQNPDAGIQYATFQKDTLVGTEAEFCSGEYIHLVMQPNYKLYQWKREGSEDIFSSERVLKIDEEGKFLVTVTDSNGCHASNAITVVETDSCFFVPNLFTPNNDAHNNEFVVKGIRLKQWELEVYNRWGDVVYKTPAYENDWKAENCSDGVYYYQLKNDKRNKYYKGWVQVMR